MSNFKAEAKGMVASKSRQLKYRNSVSMVVVVKYTVLAVFVEGGQMARKYSLSLIVLVRFKSWLLGVWALSTWTSALEPPNSAFHQFPLQPPANSCPITARLNFVE